MPIPTTYIDVYPHVDLLNYAKRTDGGTLPTLAPLPRIEGRTDLVLSDELKEALREHAERTDTNLLHNIFGVSLCDSRLDPSPDFCRKLPALEPPDVPPLPEIQLKGSIKFLERIHPTGNTLMFKATLRGEHSDLLPAKPCLLKVFSDDVPDWDNLTKDERWALYDSEKDTFSEYGFSRNRFNRETAAYARLEYYRVADSGHVPRCYGWFTLDVSTPGVPTSIVKEAREDSNPPRVLVLEFLEGVERMSIRHANTKTARAGLEAIQSIHQAFVQHCDIHPRNILFNPTSGRVIIVDFDSAYVASEGGRGPHRGQLMSEFGEMWSLFFQQLIPNSLIDWDGFC